jgi:hypothetical protein
VLLLLGNRLAWLRRANELKLVGWRTDSSFRFTNMKTPTYFGRVLIGGYHRSPKENG